jgi:hypothetical protein
MSSNITVKISAQLAGEFKSAMASAGIAFEELGTKATGAGQKMSFGSKISGEMNQLQGKFAGIGLALQGIQQVAGLVGGAIKSALAPSAEMQDLEVSFGVLLGSMTAAKDRMLELKDFANTTPFELPEVAKASRVLETLTKGALSTGEGLRMVGDVASATGQPFDELSVWIGRLYDGLQSGRPVGEAMARLQELGVMSGDVRGQIEALQKEGKKGPEVWGMATQAFGQYAGMMDVQSKTFSGLSSTMKDGINDVIRTFGDEILPDASGAVGEFSESLADLKPAAEGLGWVVSSVVKVFRTAFLGLRAFFQGLVPLVMAELGRLLSWSLSTMIGWAEKINGIVGKLLPKTWQDSIAGQLSSAKQWADGMGGYFKDVADDSVAFLDTMGGKMAAVYAPKDGIELPGGGKKKAGGGGGAGIVDSKAAKEAAAAAKEASDQARSDEEFDAKVALAKEEDRKRIQQEKLVFEAELHRQKSERDKQASDQSKARWAGVAQAVQGVAQGMTSALQGQFANLMENGKFSVTQIGKALKDSLISALAAAAAKMAMMGLMKLGMMAMGGGTPAGGILASALPQFASGTTNVPRTTLAMLHPGELVMPRAEADTYREGMAKMGGGGSPSVRGQLVDLGAEVMSVLSRNGSALVRLQAQNGAIFAGA